MNGRLAIYLRRRVAMQVLALLAVLTAMMQMLELLDVTTARKTGLSPGQARLLRKIQMLSAANATKGVQTANAAGRRPVSARLSPNCSE